MLHVARSVCLCVGEHNDMPFGGSTLAGLRNHELYVGRDPTGVNFGDCPARLKITVKFSVNTACTAAKKKSITASAAVYAAKKNHSIFNNGTICDAAFCQNSLTTLIVIAVVKVYTE